LASDYIGKEQEEQKEYDLVFGLGGKNLEGCPANQIKTTQIN
jgi:hypothetical protein